MGLIDTAPLLFAFMWEECMELVEDLGAKVNKHSYINEYMNIFAIQVKIIL